ncbi:redoxin domain-containing protein [Cohnella sp. AR92]|uniref:redoxin domain-containing protein n=1 Tax=Cohnella sp. AR92 TaxID=648716 RepID=UPI000F8C3500|nr:redoxin domain-containing protein [Cohnella sp. AR92]RUS48134.1 redoxin domain-containing protein [Cohnella sp. AR92]
MKRYRKPIQYVILAIVILIGGYAIGRSFFTTSTVLKPGQEAPAFTLADLDGTVHDLDSYKGKPLVLNFWGTFCPPCRNEMPALQHEYEKWKDQGLELVGINLSEDRISVRQFAASVGARFPILLDRNKKTEKRYGLKEYPTTFFIAPDGQIQDIVIGGPMTEEDIDARIKRLFEK